MLKIQGELFPIIESGPLVQHDNPLLGSTGVLFIGLLKSIQLPVDYQYSPPYLEWPVHRNGKKYGDIGEWLIWQL